MDHVAVPIGAAHAGSLVDLLDAVAAAAGLQHPVRSSPHVTLIAYSGLARAEAARIVEPIATAIAPFTIRARGYGFFTGTEHTELSLHVPVVRGARLDELHARLCHALERSGAEVAGWSVPELWSPHITLLDRQLDPDRLAAAVTALARRHHPSWRITIDRIVVTGGWADREQPEIEITLGGPTGDTASL